MTLRIFHAATCRHNVGDGALVAGLRRTLAEDLGVPLRFTEDDVLEWKFRRRPALTRERVHWINHHHDLVLIGGGGLLEGGRENRWNGMNYPFPPELLREFRIPVVFYAVGFNLFRGRRYHHLRRLRRTLETARAQGALVTVRNDGSRARLEAALGPLPFVTEIPDPGLYVPTVAAPPPQGREGDYVVLQLAGDQPGSRFPLGERLLELHRIPRRRWSYLGRLARALADLTERHGLRLLLAPHVPADLAPAARFAGAAPGPFLRRRTSWVGLERGVAGAARFFALYRHARAVVGMRGHAAICAVGLGTPFVGLVTHDKVRGFLKAVGLADRAVEWRAGPERLAAALEEVLAAGRAERERLRGIRRELRARTRAFHRRLAARLHLEVPA